MTTTSRAVGLVLGLSTPLFLLPTATATPATHRPHDGGISQAATPLVVGHRGASGYRPEHTLASYRLAIQLGADFIEPDLVSTKDGVLVARHENQISETTDVADHPEFADRRTTKTIDGEPLTGWFTEDFTLAEIRTLRAKERLPAVRPGNTLYDGRYQIPTFDEVLDLARANSRATGRTIGVYPETKHPSYFDSIGLSLEEPLLRELRRHHLDRKSSKVIIQSFETTNLKELNRRTPVDLAQLVDSAGAPYDLVTAGDPRTYRDLVTASGLHAVARYADGVGAEKDLVLPRDPATGATGEPSRVVADAHQEGLRVHIFTLRAENQFMATNFRRGTDPNAAGELRTEIRAFLDAGVDGIFSDNPDVAVEARDAWLAGR